MPSLTVWSNTFLGQFSIHTPGDFMEAALFNDQFAEKRWICEA